MAGTDALCARSWVTSAWSPPNSAAEGEDTPAAARGWGRGAGVERELQLRAVTLHGTAEAPGTLVRAQRRGGLAKGCLLRGPGSGRELWRKEAGAREGQAGTCTPHTWPRVRGPE